MLAILVLALASTAHGAQSLIVYNQPVDVDSIMLKVGQDVVIIVASDNYDSYTAYIGFDNGVVHGDFSFMMSWSIAGDLRDVTDYNLPAFYGYSIVANGLVVTPSPGDHFVFTYKAQQIGQTTLKLYNETFSSVIDSVDIKIVAATMGTAFSYQGHLLDDNEVADGVYDFEFELYDAPLAGNQLANTIDMNDIDVIDGLFAVELDFGSGIFDGDGVWLQSAIRPGNSDANFTTFAPRQTIMPTPYALHAATVGVPLELSASSGPPIISATNTGAGTGVYGKGTGQASRGVSGEALGNTGIGVQGTASGDQGSGVYGVGSGSAAHGVVGLASGDSSRGVYGRAINAGDVTNYGGYFVADGAQGRGVYGEASNSGDVINYGGYFRAEGRGGRGVYSQVTGGDSIGVQGVASNSGDVANYGGYFQATGKRGRGIFSRASGTNGRGVHAFADSGSGIGVESSGGGCDFYASGPGIDYGWGSSIRWKTDISPIDEPLEKLILVRGVYFNWDADHGGHHDVGMIAEEVGEVMPEIVVYEENGIDASGMDYGKLTPLLVEAVKELKVKNDSLEERVEALERAILQLAKTKESEL
jgi:hypothetical protein